MFKLNTFYGGVRGMDIYFDNTLFIICSVSFCIYKFCYTEQHDKQVLDNAA